MSKEFKLSKNLFGHSMDVRSVAPTPDNDIISGSRDRTAKFWKYNPLQHVYSDVMTFKAHENFVGSVLFLEPSTTYPDGLVITGGYDKTVHIFKPGEPFPTYTFKGEHTNTVCALTKGKSENSFLSASWDNSAKYWNLSKSTTKAIVTYSGHEAAVWYVKQLSNGNVVTGSADKNIGLWTAEGQRISTLRGHSDAVRCIEDFPELQRFISVSNDASIKIWSYSGDNIDTYYGHTSFIYSISRNNILGEDGFVTSDEDRTVRFWKNGNNIQIINLPAQSVWCVTCLPNGDVVTGSSDGVVRVFTQSKERVADETTLQRFEEEANALKNQALQEIGGYKVSDLPGKEALYDPGKQNGQMKMIRESSGVVAYTWVEEEGSGHWEKVGDVLGGAENKEGKTMYEGKEYDYVFSVDVEDGKPPLKLPFNKGDDPYVAAHHFLAKHLLPADYLEQVVDFILKNSKEQYVPPVNNEYQDPFTGGSRYTPSYNQGNQGAVAGFDPFTGGSAYTTSKPGAMLSGSSSQTSGNSNFFPITTYKSFEMGDPNVILNKLKEFNQKCGDGTQRADDKELVEMVKIATGLPNDPNAFDTLFRLLDWPDDIVFPVLDIVRLAVRHQKNNEVIVSVNNGVVMEKLKHYTNGNCKIMNNIIVSLRTLCNLCLHEPGELLVYNNRFDLFENFTSLGELNKNGQIALATCLLNITIMTSKHKDELGFSVLAQVLPDILSRLTDPEAQYRLYVATGTLIKSAEVHEGTVKAKLNENTNFLRTMQLHSFSGQNELENKRVNCVKQLSNLL